MKTAARIKLPVAMKTNAAKQIFTLLQAQEKEPQILFVGGCVRNAMLRCDSQDIDLATTHAPDAVIKILNAGGIKTIPTGLKHGTVTAVHEGQSFEITTLRRDIDTDGRHAEVEFTNSWLEDAKRRDFTINTLLMNEKGQVFDPLGAGIADLEAQNVVFVGDAYKRIQEDYLRILRFFRFSGQFGTGKLNKTGLAACIKHKAGLRRLSRERITAEFLKIITAENSDAVTAIMLKSNILKTVFHPKFQAKNFQILRKLQFSDEVSALLVIAGFSKAGFNRLQSVLLLTNKHKAQMEAVLASLVSLKATDDKSLKIMLYRQEYGTARIAILCYALKKNITVKQISALLNMLGTLEKPIFPYRGQDLIDQGMQPGPQIKQRLLKLERQWIKNDFT